MKKRARASKQTIIINILLLCNVRRTCNNRHHMPRILAYVHASGIMRVVYRAVFFFFQVRDSGTELLRMYNMVIGRFVVQVHTRVYAAADEILEENEVSCTSRRPRGPKMSAERLEFFGIRTRATRKSRKVCVCGVHDKRSLPLFARDNFARLYARSGGNPVPIHSGHAY